jgi:hypothetical protein
MDKFREMQTGSFIAKDAKGKETRILVFTKEKLVVDRSGGEWCAVSRELRTSSGERVNLGDDGTYEVGWPPVTLTSDDPNAVS